MATATRTETVEPPPERAPGHAGLPVLVFPTSGGRFYEFEDRGMIGSVAGRVEHGDLQFFCVDSVDMESWYNRNVPPR